MQMLKGGDRARQSTYSGQLKCPKSEQIEPVLTCLLQVLSLASNSPHKRLASNGLLLPVLKISSLKRTWVSCMHFISTAFAGNIQTGEMKRYPIHLKSPFWQNRYITSHLSSENSEHENSVLSSGHFGK